RLEAYFTLALLFISIFFIFSFPLLVRLKEKGYSTFKLICGFGLVCTIILILFVTLFYMPIELTRPSIENINIKPFLWLEQLNNVDQFVVEKIPNVLLFIPFGFLLPIVFKRVNKWYILLTITFLMTFTIEFIQSFIGRLADIDDIIMNLFGAMIGYALYVLIRYITKTRVKAQKQVMKQHKNR
ncbi:VanZ family protein, partial [Anaerorhabdus sp.]|uniref:VanZ family protein n=1 Tax=Anaerorhabdus sp. TaxID=1872524 RepID=UPI002FC5FC8A